MTTPPAAKTTTPPAAEATAFPETVREARRALADAPVDVASFARPLSACDVARCHGACCSDGVPLNAEETRVLAELAMTEAAAFRALGLEPASLVASAEPGGVGHTGLRARAPGERSPRHPPSVPDTACAMLTPEGFCALQVLAVDRGKNPWYWKPMVCWLHPVHADSSGIRLPSEGVSRARAYQEGSFASVTECSRAGTDPQPAYAVLERELSFLGLLIQRQLEARTA